MNCGIIISFRANGESLPDIRGVSVMKIAPGYDITRQRTVEKIRAVVSACPTVFRNQCARTERHLYELVIQILHPKICVENLERIIFNLSLSKYDANFSRLILRNLKKINKTQFYAIFLNSFHFYL